MDFFSPGKKKEKSPFGSEYKKALLVVNIMGILVYLILLIYNSSIHGSLKVRVTSSCALRAPEDKH